MEKTIPAKLSEFLIDDQSQTQILNPLAQNSLDYRVMDNYVRIVF